MTSKFIAATMLVVVSSITASMVGASSIEQSKILSSYSDMHITSVQLHDLQDPHKAFIAFTVLNTGTSTLVSTDLSFRDDSEIITNITSTEYIKPSESWKEEYFVDAHVNKNSKYILYVNANTSDGSEISEQRIMKAI